MYTASIYFLGQYRPAYFQAETASAALYLAHCAICGAADYEWFSTRLSDAYTQIAGRHCTSWSAEHGCRGVSLVAHEHNTWLDGVTQGLPPYPGLDYSAAVNV